MRLTPLEQRCLSLIQFDADLSVRELASKYKLPERSLRHAINRLRQSQVIKKVPYIDIFKIGFGYSILYFSIGKGGKSLREDLIQTLLRSDRVSWLAELGGDFQYGIGIIVKNPNDTRDFIHGISKRYLSTLHEKSIMQQASIALFPRKYFGSSGSADKRQLYSESGADVVKTDEVDLHILSHLSVNGSASGRELGRLLGLSHTAIDYRLQKLRSRGVIRDSFYRVDARKLGFNTYKIVIFTKGVYPEIGTKLREMARTHQQIVLFIECLGTWDYEINVDASSTQDVMPVVHELFDHFGEFILSVKIVPLLRILKFQQFPLGVKQTKPALYED